MNEDAPSHRRGIFRRADGAGGFFDQQIEIGFAAPAQLDDEISLGGLGDGLAQAIGRLDIADLAQLGLEVAGGGLGVAVQFLVVGAPGTLQDAGRRPGDCFGVFGLAGQAQPHGIRFQPRGIDQRCLPVHLQGPFFGAKAGQKGRRI